MFMLNHMIGFGARRAIIPVPDIIIGSAGTPYTSPTNSATYTATGLPAVAADERAVIAIAIGTASTVAINSITIGGNACSELHHVDNSGTTVALYIGPVGATGDVAVTMAASVGRCLVSVWPCKNIQSAVPTATAGSTANPANASISCQAGGAIFGIAHNRGGTAYTWTNLTESFDAVPESGNGPGSGAADVFASGVVSRSITANPSNNTSPAMALVALR